MSASDVVTREAVNAGFVAEQVTRSGEFELPCDADTAFPFFSPEGERRWVDGWNPQPVFPAADGVTFATDAVFRLEMGGERSVWVVLNVDLRARVAEYVYVVENSRVARVRVEATTVVAERSAVAVSYTITALSEGGNEFVREFTEEAYAQKMRDWQKRVSAVLARS